ncbi:pseudo histidine-containing phosphotransfer protein 2-like [Telopea speciosissima]|uniref:pseudo histidine-containing phosphotransfer protein 2-like n=1 Tax=Telopea speciosissima TaxID=54955 RepID=UPI001CC4D5B4|nr:pseudo histidine-containing phosphotransfer protein 2-like [Telopea speciosissima]
MDNNQLKHQAVQMKQSLFEQGYLDEMFNEIEEIHCDDPKFHEKIVNMFFNDSAQLITNIQQALEQSPIDFSKLEKDLNKIKEITLSTGAKKVRDMSDQAIECCLEQNVEGCKDAFEQLKTEHATLKEKLQSYFHLARQAKAADGASGSN